MGTIGIFTLIASVLMGIAGIASTAKANKQNIENQQKMLEREQAFATESAEKANEETRAQYYELHSPAAQVQQMKDAGLSPALFYSGGGGGVVGNAAAQAQSPQLNAPLVNPLVKGNEMNMLSDVMQQATENELTKAETKSTYQGIENMKQQIKESEAVINKYEKEAHNTEVSTKNLDLQNKMAEFDVQIKEATVKDAIEMIKKQRELIEKNVEETIEIINGLRIENSKKEEMINAQIRKMNAEINKLGKESFLIEAQTLVAEAEEELKKAEKKLTDKQREEVEQKIRIVKVQANKIEFAPWTAESSGWIDKCINIAIDGCNDLIHQLGYAGITVGNTVGGGLKKFNEWQQIERRDPNHIIH